MKHKILIIDDDASIRTMFQRIFCEKYTVLEAADGISALEIIKQECPTIIFLDITMPKKSGIEILKHIKETDASCVIWMLTGERNINIALTTLKMGASGYLTKPFDIQKMREIIKNVTDDCDRKSKHAAPDDRPWHVEKEEQ